MKIRVLNTILSCISKCIGFSIAMINKKVILGFIILISLGACSSPTVMLGPAYTFSSTGNVLQAGLTYGSNEMITRHTGKTPIQNLQEISSIENNNFKNIQKSTLESNDFHILVKNRIKKTNKILNLSNQ